MTEATIENWPGRPYPLGAAYDGGGTNFSLFSEMAEGVELCLFDDERRGGAAAPRGNRRVRLARLPADGRARAALRLPGARAVGARARPAMQPGQAAPRPLRQGHRGPGRLEPGVLPLHHSATRTRATTTTAPRTCPGPWCTTRSSTGATTGLPDVELNESVIYEVHVKGFTARHPDIPEAQRGTYSGLAHPAAIEHLTGLGVTAVELLPVHQFVHDAHLIERGLRNYWGYNSIGFLAPHNEYAATGQQRRAGRRVQGDGPRAARGGHRGDPRRRLQPHRRGQPSGTRSCP